MNERKPSGSDTEKSKDVKTDSLAIASIATGIAGLLLFFTGFGGFSLGIVAIVFGYVAKGRIKKSFGALKGKKLANTGIITGFISVGLTILLIILFLIYFI